MLTLVNAKANMKNQNHETRMNVHTFTALIILWLCYLKS